LTAKENRQSKDEIKSLIETIHKRLFVILCDIDDFCRENKITYFLSGGTCLGAARHTGFIPWDDDVDIMMPRKDYERFIELFSKAKNGKYKVGDYTTDKNWKRPWARVCDLHSVIEHGFLNEEKMGFFIDVFPIDGLPAERHIKRYFRKMKFLDVMRTTSMRKSFIPGEKYVFIKKILGLYTSKKGTFYFLKKSNQLAKRYDFTSSEFVAVSLITQYGMREKIRRECMNSAAYLKFEGRDFPVPVGWETYLSNLYGNWKEIPKDAAEKGYTHLENWKITLLENDMEENKWQI